MDSIEILRKNCIYTSCYCEENVWKLLEKLKVNYCVDLSQSYAVFISNENKKIPIWYQKASSTPFLPVVWDYHVVLVHKGQTTPALVFDLDTTLEFPCRLQEYAEKALRSEDGIIEMCHRLFRVIPAPRYLETFASDRSHMLNKDGKWRQPPPSYPPIKTQETVVLEKNSDSNFEQLIESTMNLLEYIDMNREKGEGTVMNLSNFLKHFECEFPE